MQVDKKIKGFLKCLNDLGGNDEAYFLLSASKKYSNEEFTEYGRFLIQYGFLSKDFFYIEKKGSKIVLPMKNCIIITPMGLEYIKSWREKVFNYVVESISKEIPKLLITFLFGVIVGWMCWMWNA